MVTERVITLSTELTEGEIVKSHLLFSFINIDQRGRKHSIHIATVFFRIKFDTLTYLSTVAAAFISVTQSPDGIGD